MDALENLTAVIRDAAAGEDEVEIAVRGSRVQVHGHLMRASDCGNLALAFLSEEWTRRALRAVRIAATVRSADLAIFCTSFLETDLSAPDVAEHLAATVLAAGIRTIKIEPREEKEELALLLLLLLPRMIPMQLQPKKKKKKGKILPITLLTRQQKMGPCLLRMALIRKKKVAVV
ncbi:MAG: hypothetical protein HC813_02980, partial [Planctomycetes bacterium]|nr:hypothetical protein [Planctomycetota bacterium]